MTPTLTPSPRLALVALASALGAACGAAPGPSSGRSAGGVTTGAPRSVPASAAPSAAPATSIRSETPSAPPRTVPAPTCSAHDVLATWSVRRLAEQTVVVPVDERDVASVTPEVAAGAGGIVLFGPDAPRDLGTSIGRLAAHAPGGIAPFVMTDEEGGVVQRMANLVGPIPSARDMAATLRPPQIEQLALDVGRRMRAAGVTMDLAPVLDLDGGAGPDARNPDGTRSFSPDAGVASASGNAFAAGLEAAGVIPVVKHFPGLGGATANTDDAPGATLPWSVLRGGGLLPFEAAVRAGVPAVMVSDASVPGLTDAPSSLSSAVIMGVLRGHLGFAGLVLTDSLSAQAIVAAGYTVPQASIAALSAGADMVLYTAAAGAVAMVTSDTVQAIVAAVGSGALSRIRLEDAVLHVLTAKRVDLCAAAPS